MPTLQEFIDDCVAQVNARRAAEEAEKQQREADFQALLQSVVTSVKQRLAPAIPQPLRQFAGFAGRRPSLEELQGYPDRWTPTDFKIEAPGLNRIDFTVSASDTTGPIVVNKIMVNGVTFGTDWIEAVAAAVITP